jgi:Tir chaperone protein (CesT) family
VEHKRCAQRVYAFRQELIGKTHGAPDPRACARQVFFIGAIMDDRDFIRSIMQEVGPRDDGILQVLQTSDNFWVVRFEEVDVELELDPEMRRLTLSAEIGVVTEEKRAKLYETLLLYNLLWRETGGLRMALAEPGGSVIQCVDMHCSALTTELLAIVLHNLDERTLLWREFFEGGDAPEPVIDAPEYSMIQL